MEDDVAERPKLVPAVERASIILDIVSTSKRYPTVSDLAREAGLPKSTVHGLCSTLTHLGLLIRRPDQSFVLGPHLLKWSNAFERQTDIAAEFATLWDQAEDIGDGVVSLCIPDGLEVVFIASRQRTALERFKVRPGMRLPAVFSAAGKAMIARWSDHEIQRAIKSLPEPLTERSVGTVKDLLAEVHLVREQGVAVEEGQCQRGVTNFGAAVVNSLSQTVAAVLITLDAEDLPPDALVAFSNHALALAGRLSQRLGAETVG